MQCSEEDQCQSGEPWTHKWAFTHLLWRLGQSIYIETWARKLYWNMCKQVILKLGQWIKVEASAKIGIWKQLQAWFICNQLAYAGPLGSHLLSGPLSASKARAPIHFCLNHTFLRDGSRSKALGDAEGWCRGLISDVVSNQKTTICFYCLKESVLISLFWSSPFVLQHWLDCHIDLLLHPW